MAPRLAPTRLALCLVLWVCGAAAPAGAALLAQGQTVRSIPFELRDTDKPMVRAEVAGRAGVLMFDTGTPDLLMLNCAALRLGPGRFVARGAAASGQAVEVQAHAGPPVLIDGRALATPDTLRSGDFAFTVSGLGGDFLGFIGASMVKDLAFVLDYARRRWTVLRVAADGTLPVAGPAADEVRVSVPFLVVSGGLPTVAAAVSPWPVLTDFDTGDSGTLYLSPQLRAALLAQGLLKSAPGQGWLLHGLQLGGQAFDATPVRLVQAGGAEDFRSSGQADQLRLGARFLASNPCLWNMPAKTLTFLAPQARFLKDVVAAAP